MHQDIENKYRPKFEEDFFSFTQRVESPWETVPDLKTYNSEAHKKIKRELNKLKKKKGNQSQGVLILGEAGTGKTHQIMRLAKELCETNQILFVRKPTDEETVSQHIWLNIIRSLSRELPVRNGKMRSQLEDMLAHVFSNVLIETFEGYIAEGKDVKNYKLHIKKLKSDPYNLFSMLGKADDKLKNIHKISKLTLGYLEKHHPEINGEITKALLLYCFQDRDEDKRILKNWLEGNDIGSKEAERLNITPTWIKFDEHSSQSVYQKQREEFAQNAIMTLGMLSTYYNPLILVFDQLEALRGDKKLTREWGHALLDIFNRAPNIFVITCIFPSLWETWFKEELDASTRDRISNKNIKLDKFKTNNGQEMLEVHMDEYFNKFKLPEKIYPFEVDDIKTLCKSSISPRSYLKNCTERLEYWLDEKDPAEWEDEFPGSESLNSTEFLNHLKKELDKFKEQDKAKYDEDNPSEQDFFGRLKNILSSFLAQMGRQNWIGTATCDNKVMPPNLVIPTEEDNNSICISVMNGAGNAFAARLKNLAKTFEEQEQFKNLIILRDARCKELGKASDKRLNELRNEGVKVLSIDGPELNLINSVYDMLVAVEEHDITYNDKEIDIPRYLEFLKNENVLLQSNLFKNIGFKATEEDEQPSRNGDGPTHINYTFNFMNPDDMPSSSGNSSSSTKDSMKRKKAVDPEPEPGETTTALQEDMTEITIGLKKSGSPYKGRIGNLKNSQRPISISLNKPQGIAVMGYMGSGKSYALGVMIENGLLSVDNLIKQSKPICVVAFNYRRNPDARFEYSGFAVPNHQEGEISALKEKYNADPKGVEIVNVLGHEKEIKFRKEQYDGLPTYPIQFRSNELRAEQWEILMKPPTKQSEYMNILRSIIADLHYEENLTLESLENQIQNDQRFSNSQRNRALNRLSFAKEWINDDRDYEWEDIFKPGSFNTFDLRMQTMEASDALSLCLVITDIIRRTKNGVNKMIVFDEAHEYMDSKLLVDDLENCLTQIRHDGLSFVVATQFPETIPESIFKFLLTRFIFQLPTTKAINHLKKASPNLETLSKKDISNLGLEKGICYLQTDEDCTDNLMRTAQLVEVRPRCTLHGGATIRNH